MNRLFATSDSALQALLRLTLALVFFPHGAQKVLGWFGGHGLGASMEQLTHGLGLPSLLAVLAITAEFLGAIALFFGFLTRIAAFGLLCNMVVAVLLIHAKVGFFMNSGGRAPPGREGFELHLLAIALLVDVLVRGAGALSVNRALTRTRHQMATLPTDGIRMIAPHARTTL